MEIKTVGIASDHAGYPLKKFVLVSLKLASSVNRSLLPVLK